MKLTITILIFLLTSATVFAQDNMTACNRANTRAKMKCGRLVGEAEAKVRKIEEDAKGNQGKKCGDVARLKPNDQQHFERVCKEAVSEATAECGQSATGGIEGQNGALTVQEELEDLNESIKAIKEEYDKNWARLSCSNEMS